MSTERSSLIVIQLKMRQQKAPFMRIRSSLERAVSPLNGAARNAMKLTPTLFF